MLHSFTLVLLWFCVHVAPVPQGAPCHEPWPCWRARRWPMTHSVWADRPRPGRRNTLWPAAGTGSAVSANRAAWLKSRILLSWATLLSSARSFRSFYLSKSLHIIWCIPKVSNSTYKFFCWHSYREYLFIPANLLGVHIGKFFGFQNASGSGTFLHKIQIAATFGDAFPANYILCVAIFSSF